MSTPKSKADQLIDAATALAETIRSAAVYVVSWGIIVLIAAVVLKEFGVTSKWLPTMDHTKLAYLCGAWWLYRGRS